MSNQSSSLPPSILCIPLFCDGNHSRPVGAASMENYARRIFQESRIGMIYLLLQIEPLATSLTSCRYFKSLVGLDVNSAVNKTALDIWKSDYKEVLVKAFTQDCNAAISWFACYLTQFSQTEFEGIHRICMSSYSEASLIEFSDATSFFMDDAFNFGPLAVTLTGLKNKKWTKSQIQALRISIADEILQMIPKSFEGTSLAKWVQYLDRNMKFTRLLHFTLFMETFPPSLLGPTGLSTGLPFTVPMQTWWEWEIIQKLPFRFDSGDQLAARKDYVSALSHYALLNFLGVDSEHLIQSLSNGAALRLRLSTKEPKQIPMAISDCTLALSIDPNHAKALFRRGLGLALEKRWNQAIVDFERALEIDPNSPAKKELTVARRQVTRTTEN